MRRAGQQGSWQRCLRGACQKRWSWLPLRAQRSPQAWRCPSAAHRADTMTLPVLSPGGHNGSRGGLREFCSAEVSGPMLGRCACQRCRLAKEFRWPHLAIAAWAGRRRSRLALSRSFTFSLRSNTWGMQLFRCTGLQAEGSRTQASHRPVAPQVLPLPLLQPSERVVLRHACPLWLKSKQHCSGFAARTTAGDGPRLGYQAAALAARLDQQHQTVKALRSARAGPAPGNAAKSAPLRAGPAGPLGRSPLSWPWPSPPRNGLFCFSWRLALRTARVGQRRTAWRETPGHSGGRHISGTALWDRQRTPDWNHGPRQRVQPPSLQRPMRF